MFDPRDLPSAMRGAPASLQGSEVDVWWLPDFNSDESGRYWPATLHMPPHGWKPKLSSRSKEGWFSIRYGDDESYGDEVIFIAVTPGDPTTYTAFREDAESLAGGVGGEFRFREVSSARFSSLVAAMPEQHPASSLGSGSDSLGRRVSLYWDEDAEWYSGTITAFRGGKHYVRVLDVNRNTRVEQTDRHH